ncbi:MAG: hypothetical protein ACRD16_00515 [Thermoanaerobaculia bacterium]
MKFEPSLWREKIWLLAPAILFFLANLVYFLAGRAVDASRSEALIRSRDNARSRVEAAIQAEKKAAADAERVEKVRRAEEEFFGKRIGTLNDTIAATVADIHRVSRNANASPHAITYSVAMRRNVPLTEMSISFGVAGDYRTLRRLLQSFENDSRWIVVRQVQLSRAGETVASGNIHLSLSTYFYEGNLPEKGVEPAKAQNAKLDVREGAR